MLTEDFTLQFEGFDPSEDVLKRLRLALSDLYARSPHRSFLKATFKFTGHMFEGAIHITSAAEQFVSKVTAKDFDSLSKSALEDLNLQLQSWKTTRFM
jgi:hypothetical protein